jgi:hypothetical protein
VKPVLQYVSTSQIVCLAVTVLLKTILALVVLRRQVYRKYPYFSAYCFVIGAKSWFLFCSLHLSAYQYFLCYWPAQALENTAMLAVAAELVYAVFLPGRMISFRVMRYFYLLTVTLITMSCIVAHMQRPTSRNILNAFISIDLGTAYIVGFVISATLLWSSLFTVNWSQEARTVAIGMAVLVVVSDLLPASRYFVTLSRSVSVMAELCVDSFVLWYWIRGLWLIRKTRVLRGGDRAELLRLLELGKGFQDEVENLRGVA